MKNSFQAGQFIPVEALLRSAVRPRLWRSPEEYENPEFARDAESEKYEDGTVSFGESDRRRFLSLMAGSLALAGLTGCTRQPTEQILPYVTPPENAIPGKPKFYATAVPVHGGAEGVLVESHLGRPTKVEGNLQHPASLGSTCVTSQACLMDLYDADRAKQIKHLGIPQTWDEFLLAFEHILEPIRARQGAGLHILTEPVTSPTLGGQMQALLKALPSTRWHQFEPAGNDSARGGALAAFGRPVNTFYRFENADIIVSLDSDFLASGRDSTRNARGFAERRRRGNRTDMNRLYAIECEMTSTGGKADQRLPLRYREIENFARALAAALAVSGAQPVGPSSYTNFVTVLAKDLQAHSGASVILPGEYQSPAVHALAHAMNASLGSVGKTVFYTEPLEIQPVDQIASLKSLVSALQAGQVELLLILGGNPVYNAPADITFAGALAKARHSVRVALHEDETSALCHWNIPESHFLEDWGDTRSFDGSITIQQPLIAPLYDSRTPLQLIDVILQPPGRPTYDIVRGHWQQLHKGDFEAFWRKSVHDGVVADSALPPITPALQTVPPSSTSPPSGALEIVFRPDVYMYDGRYANNVWLQELPHPMTKLTWDNAVHISPNTARQLKLENQQRVELRLSGRIVRGSVWISPGHPDGSVLVHLGYGRTRAGRAGDGAGFSAYVLRTSDALWSAQGVEIYKVNESYPLASTQMHQFMEGRDVALSLNGDQYRQDPNAFDNYLHQKMMNPAPGDTLYPRWSYTGYAWGMSIDQTACVNCNACVIACQAENNIPVVGKGQVLARRAMHWLRIDTYYEGNLERPTAYYQPIPCMQCENAPCELVCPVQATNHSSDGLNDMVYNRCVGTRYCSNNCPYKVRRFNFLLYQDWRTESWKLQRNPDVTVRSRGVMEKCTYCVQRIREAEIDARDRNDYIKDGAIQTACQQVCPTQAIVFGDINNKDNRVAKLKAEKLNYSLLGDLNTRPRTTYLAELRNPNPDLKESNG